MTPEVELAARIVGQRDRAAEIKRCQEKLARLMQEQETAGNRQGDGKMEDDCDYLEGCYLCGGKRYIVTCIDDLCRNSYECMHGDGEEDCPACNKTGELEWEIF